MPRLSCVEQQLSISRERGDPTATQQHFIKKDASVLIRLRSEFPGTSAISAATGEKDAERQLMRTTRLHTGACSLCDTSTRQSCSLFVQSPFSLPRQDPVACIHQGPSPIPLNRAHPAAPLDPSQGIARIVAQDARLDLALPPAPRQSAGTGEQCHPSAAAAARAAARRCTALGLVPA